LTFKWNGHGQKVQKVTENIMDQMEAQAMTDIVIVVEDGRVTAVYASEEDAVMVEVIDRDTQNPEEQEEIDEQCRQLECQIANAQMFQIY